MQRQTAFSADRDENVEKVEDLMLSQEAKPKTHWSTREISRETDIPRSSGVQDYSQRSPAEMLQTTSCSAVVLS